MIRPQPTQFLRRVLAAALALGAAAAVAAQCPGGAPAPPPVPAAPPSSYRPPPRPSAPRPSTPQTPAALPATAPGGVVGATTPRPAGGRPITPTRGGATATPTAPTTPPGLPTTGGAARALPLDFRRGPTAREFLALDWSLPVVEVAVGQTTQARQSAMSRADAVAWLRGADPRPLLVVRECTCSASHGGLLIDNLAPESLRILGHWFHCVRLPEAARRADHPAHALFDDGAWHVLTDNERGELVPIAARPGELLRRLRATIVSKYPGGADGWQRRVGDLEGMLKDMDRLDGERSLAWSAYVDEVEERGATARSRVLRERLDRLGRDREEILRRCDERLSLPPR